MKELNEQQLKALKKIETELEKDITIAVEMAKHGMFFDLLYFVYSFKTLRLNEIVANEQKRNTSFLQTTTHAYEDITKYVIQLLTKFGTTELAQDKESGMPHINFNMTEALFKQCTYINSKYESKSMVQLFDIELLDEEAKKLKIDTKSVKTDEDVKKFFDYFLRIDQDNDIKKAQIQNKEDLLNKFKEEYEPSKELFEKVFGITLDEYCDFILWILNKSQEEIIKAKEKFEYLENGNVNDQSLQTMLAFVPSLFLTKGELESKFGTKYNTAINLMTFEKANFNERELKFHYITRAPFIPVLDGYLMSPELLLDSLHTNVHYSLTESKLVREEYKAIQANSFLDKLVQLSGPLGYTEVAREVDLYEGKNQIGDIDLILKDDKNNYILIEAKNHALAMDIYFKDLTKTREHLKELQATWEKKVSKRIEHLKLKHNDYSIPSTYQYLVVSRFPEIIAHYSDILALSVAEFEYWLKRDRWSGNFSIITEEFYKVHSKNYSIEDLEKLSEFGLMHGKFAKK